MKSKLLFIVAALSLTTAAFAQIPNNSFENWTTVGSYSDPNSWSTLNATTNPLSIYTCTKGTGGASGGGSAYLKLISKTVLTAVVPAVPAQPATVAVTLYVPALAIKALTIVGFCNVDVNPFGPVQE